MIPSLPIGPVVVPTGSLTILVGLWLSLSLVEKTAARRGLNATYIYNLATTAVVAAFIGARLFFVGLHWSAYQDNLFDIIWPLNSGFNLWGGLIFGLAGGFFYGRARQLPPAATLDALAPGLVALLLTASLADFLAGTGYGTVTTMPWGLSLFAQPLKRHPVQVYEILVGLLALAAWWRWQRRAAAGELFLVTAAVYSAGRLWVDAYRGNTWITAGGWHGLQLLCFVMVLASLAWLAWRSPVRID